MGKRTRLLPIFLLAFFMILPILLTTSNAFMSSSEILKHYGDGAISAYKTLHFIPSPLSIEQFVELLIRQPKFLMLFWNTVGMVVPIVVGQVMMSALAAYAFAKLKFPFRKTLFFIYVMLMLLPFQVSLVPNYFMLDRLGLLNSRLAVILPGVFSTFGVVLLRQFMITIPDECIEAAVVDGCSPLQVYWHIVLPMSKEGIAALFILTFIDYWNMIEQPLVFIMDTAKHPLSLALAGINHSDIGLAFAAGFIYMIPVLLVFYYGESHMVEGLNQTGLK